MSRIAVLNILLGGLASALVSILVVLEYRDATAPTTPTTTVAPTTIPPTTTTTTTTLPPTTTTTTTTTSTIPRPTIPPGERFFTAVVVVNGTTQGERLAPVRQRLRDAGYGTTRGIPGAVLASQTIFYALDPAWRAEAALVAADLGYDPRAVPIELFEEAPPIPGLLDAKVIVYLGPDPLPETFPFVPPPVPTTEAPDTSTAPTSAEPASDPPPVSDPVTVSTANATTSEP